VRRSDTSLVRHAQQPDLIHGHLPSCDGPNIRSFDPALTTVRTAYPAPPFPPFPHFLHPPIKPASSGPGGHLDPDWRVDFPSVCCGKLLYLVVAEIRSQLEYASDSGGRGPRRRRRKHKTPRKGA